MNRRQAHGISIAETAASLVLLIPILFLVLFVIIECSKAYYIKDALAQGARQAARDMAIAYGQNKQIQYNRPMQDTVYDNVRIPSVINSSAQFDDAQFSSSASPTVTVTVRYTSGQNGLPKFPDPDPLKLGASFKLQASSTYRVE
jgi:Flp pilus assembly protein TadG